MSIKIIPKRFNGIKPENHSERPKTRKEKTKEFISSLLFALIAALIIITFIVQNTRIPTGSMENTILVGDFVLVNKFIYGSSSPRFIPFTNIPLPHFILPAFREPRRKDVVVFEYPGEKDQMHADDWGVNYVKRCIGLPGDTVQIINKIVYVNRKPIWIPTHIYYSRSYIKSPGEVNEEIFPKGMHWNVDNYGPIIVPKKGYTIKLTNSNIEMWRTIIDREYGERVVKINNGAITIQGRQIHSYTFTKDYYFMMGDNRDDSWDSRFWGFVPRDAIVGEAFIILFSWDRNIPFIDIFRLIGSIRTERILKLIH